MNRAIEEIECGNVRMVAECEILPNRKLCRQSLEWFIGKAAKIALQTVNSRVEHVWIRVERVEGNELEGFILNEPLFLEEIQFGDSVRFRRTEIEAVETK